MTPVIILGEITLLTLLVCTVHRLRDRLGMAPLFMLMGLFEAFLFFVGKTSPAISAEFFFVEPRGIYLLFLPTILVSAVIVYVLDGTRAARQFMIGLIVIYVVHGFLDVIVEYHATNPPPGKPSRAGIDLIWYSLHGRFAGMVAMVADFIVVLIVFQFVRNRLSRIPLAVPIFLGLIAGMLADAVVYKLIRHGSLSESVFFLGAKAQAGAAAGLPASLYVAWMLRRHPISDEAGLERGAFEIVDLRRKVAEMQQRLQEQQAQYLQIKETFSRYVSAEVVNAIIADPSKLELGGELRDVTVLFADIRGYSTLSENMDPTEVITLLNRYFAAVSREILDEKGMINEFEGDAVLAVFGAPIDLENNAVRAVRAAIRMLHTVEGLNAEWATDGTLAKWQAAGLDKLAIRIGVHTGSVVAGNIGSEARTKYAIIGDTVNTTSRVEGLNKELLTSLLLTEATANGLKEHPLAQAMVDMGDHKVKGRAETVHVFTMDTEKATGLMTVT